ncbi:MAG: glycosyltransferase [Chitinophagaceae bacterium]
MESKKTILHIIPALCRGGAETILVTTVKELKNYRNIVVTFYNANGYTNELVCDKLINLNIKNSFFSPFYCFKLRKIIRNENVDLVHSRLFWATMLARLAVPKKIPLITTIHSYISKSFEYKKFYIRWVDKLFYRFHKSIMLADSGGALNDYFSYLKLKPFKAISPYTFVDPRIFKANTEKSYKSGKIVKLITVGRIAKQKNHQFFIDAFKLLKDEPIELHIYGYKAIKEDIETQIQQAGVKIILKGQVDNLNELLPQYDIFVMASVYEGFSLAVLEAMAMGMPLLLSNIESFKEQCEETAIYFNLINQVEFVDKLKQLTLDEEKRKRLGNAAKERVLKHFTLDKHMKVMNSIYESALGS